MTTNVTVLKPLDNGEGEAIVAIDGKPVKVKVHYRLKSAAESKIDRPPHIDITDWCTTWAVMKFDDPEIRKRKDYKSVWKEVFSALMERDTVYPLQREYRSKSKKEMNE